MLKVVKPNEVKTNRNLIKEVDFTKHIREFTRFKRFTYVVLVIILIIILLLGLRFKPDSAPKYTALGRLLKQQGTQIILQEGALINNNLCVYDEEKGLDCSLDPSTLNTDSQELSLSQNILSISNGNSVVFDGWDTNVFDDVKYLTQLLDVSVSTPTNASRVLKYDGFKWVDGLLNFIELGDTPTSYSPLQLLRVKNDSSGIEYVNFDDLSYWKRQNNALTPSNLGDDVVLDTSEALYIRDLIKGGIMFASDQGLVTSDADELYWDEVNQQMGIGIGRPKAKLHIDSVKLGEDKLLITGNNSTSFVTKVGIAGTTRLEKLTTTVRTPDGGVLLVGYILDTVTNKKDAYVLKMDITGNIDPSFGINGSLVFESSSGGDDEFLAATLSGDSSAYFLAGKVDSKKGFVVKLNLDGTLDTGFANNGVFVFDIGTYSSVVDVVEVYNSFYKPPKSEVYLLVESDVSNRVYVVKLDGDTGALDSAFKGGVVTIEAASAPGSVVPKKIMVTPTSGLYILVDLTGGYALDKVSDIGIYALSTLDGTPLSGWANTRDPDYLVIDTGEADYVLGGFFVGGLRATDMVIIGKQVTKNGENPIFIKLRDIRVGLLDSASVALTPSRTVSYIFASVNEANSKLLQEAYIGGTDNGEGVLMKVVEAFGPGGVKFAWDKPLKYYNVYSGGVGSTAIYDVAVSGRDDDIVGMSDPDYTVFGIDEQGLIKAPASCFSQGEMALELRILSVKISVYKAVSYGAKLATRGFDAIQDSAGELLGMCSSTTTGVALIVDEVGRVGVRTSSPSAAFQIGNPGDGTYGLANGWNSFSDARLKEDITALEVKALELIDELNPVRFRWKSSKKRDVGFIAQDVKGVFPDIVAEVDGLLTIDYDGFIPLLVKALQELDQRTKASDLSFLEVKDNSVVFNKKVVTSSLVATSIDTSVIRAESVQISDKVLINGNGEVSLKELNTDILRLSSKSKGTVTLQAGDTSIRVVNNLVSEDTLVVVTPYTNSPVVFSVVRGDGYFEIKIPNATDSDIEFGWMIVR